MGRTSCPRGVSLSEKLKFYSEVMPSGCWEWNRALSTGGYGQCKWGGIVRRSHRLAYEVWRGPLTPGLQLDHLCRNRKCINPYHLEEVTAKVNNLRGVGPSARNAKKTHCPSGHAYSGENLVTYTRRNGNKWRVCRVCKRSSSLAYMRRARARQRLASAVQVPLPGL